jgi:hypothetical protein
VATVTTVGFVCSVCHKTSPDCPILPEWVPVSAQHRPQNFTLRCAIELISCSVETARIITLAADRRRRPVLGRRYANADRRGDNDHMEDALWDLTPPRVPNGNNTQPSMRAFDILERTGNMANTRVGGTAGQGPSHTEQTEVDSAQGSTINQRTEAGTAVPNHERAHTTEERGGTGEFIGGNQVHVGLANVAQSRQRSYNPFAGAGHTTVAGTDWM